MRPCSGTCEAQTLGNMARGYSPYDELKAHLSHVNAATVANAFESVRQAQKVVLAVRCQLFANGRISVVAVHIGTSGWSYAHWTTVLYPEGLPAERRLDHYARQFQTVELNASYRWSSDAAFAGWQRRLPDGFVVTVKAPGALTHAKRLYGPEAWLARIGQGLDRLGPKRGVLLVQLPPSAAL